MITPNNTEFKFLNTQSFCLGTATNSTDTISTDLFVLFPNPASSYIQVKSTNYDTLLTIDLIDQTGRKIKMLL